MDNKEFSKGLEKRTRKFAVSIIQLSTGLPNTPEGRAIRNQITKSGTSIGANYREANRARSKADFKNKIKICEAEASETQYWIEVIVDAKWLPWEKVTSEYDEWDCLPSFQLSEKTNSSSL
jgi:four helix bundle protein